MYAYQAKSNDQALYAWRGPMVMVMMVVSDAGEYPWPNTNYGQPDWAVRYKATHPPLHSSSSIQLKAPNRHQNRLLQLLPSRGSAPRVESTMARELSNHAPVQSRVYTRLDVCLTFPLGLV